MTRPQKTLSLASEPDPSPGPSVADPETADLHEVELVERARGGNVQAWARLYQERHDWLLREVTFLVGDLSLAEDLVQESFARALSGLPRDGPTCHTGCAESR